MFIVSFFSVEISARGQITKNNQSRLKSFLHKCCVSNRSMSKALIRVSSKAALLSSYSIFAARKEPTWEDPAPLLVQWSVSRLPLFQLAFYYSFITCLLLAFNVWFLIIMTCEPVICIRLFLPRAQLYNLVICWVSFRPYCLYFLWI